MCCTVEKTLCIKVLVVGFVILGTSRPGSGARSHAILISLVIFGFTWPRAGPTRTAWPGSWTVPRSWWSGSRAAFWTSVAFVATSRTAPAAGPWTGPGSRSGSGPWAGSTWAWSSTMRFHDQLDTTTVQFSSIQFFQCCFHVLKSWEYKAFQKD